MNATDRQKFKKIKCYLFDLDGTVYLDGVLYDKARETVEYLASFAEICYLTNNSSRSRVINIDRLKSLGLPVSARQFMSSTDAASDYLVKNHAGEGVYAVATDPVKEELRAAGVTLVEENPSVVLLAYDTTLTFEKLNKLCYYVSKGAVFYATHPDIVCPAPEVPMPDVGAFLACIQAATGERPQKIFGKPFMWLAEAVKQRFGLETEEIAMVGDRLSTDMLFAQNNGFLSVLTLTGETTREMIGGRAPDVIIESIAELLEVERPEG